MFLRLDVSHSLFELSEEAVQQVDGCDEPPHPDEADEETP